jgi:hypothetical protein
MTLLPTPRTSDTNGTGEHGDGGPDLRTAVTLLPTPTATPYGNNQSPSPGATVRPSLNSLAPKLLPTPRASDGEKGGPNQRSGRGKYDALPGAVVHLLPTPMAADGERESATYGRGNPTLRGALLPTPRVSAGRTGRSAITASSSSPSLEQAVELVQGITPRELEGITPPPSWTGAATPPPSPAGKRRPAAVPHGQLTITDA